MLSLTTQRRTLDSVVLEAVDWNPSEVAVILCDVWDKHWCDGATGRVNELVPTMNEVVGTLRELGVLVIHAPSDTIAFYEGTPQRRRAINAPSSGIDANIPGFFGVDEPALPIDDSDGGCDSGAENSYRAWTRQHPGIGVDSADAISDSGQEVLNLLVAEKRSKLLIMGVHTNMCILGRSFAIRRMLALGMSVLLVRDMTDAMYNPAKHPYVSHFAGTQLVIEHIERYLCPSIESSDITGKPAFTFRGQV